MVKLPIMGSFSANKCATMQYVSIEIEKMGAEMAFCWLASSLLRYHLKHRLTILQ